MTRRLLHPLACAFSIVLPAGAQAQTSPAAPLPVYELSDIVVTGGSLDLESESLTLPASVLSGEALSLKSRGSLGELLDGTPGVHADTFGGGASRPVIRGQTAPRVKVLSDGSEIIDASGVSPDHVVTADTLLARRIDVLRGPSALLYGGNALGGVVNVLDDKIPVQIPDAGVSGAVNAYGGTVANERAGSVGLTIGGGNMALRLEGTRRRADDYRVPHWTHAKVPDSSANSTTGSIGASYIGERGYVGAAYSYREDDYGLPGHTHDYEDCHIHGSVLHCGGHEHNHDHGHSQGHAANGHDHHHDDHVVKAYLRSKRLDVRGELDDPFAGFSKLSFRGGYTDYRHDEREDGVVGTTFTHRGHDGRLTLRHNPLAGWEGDIGIQVARYDFASFGGAESFIPKTRTQSGSLFLFETTQWNDWFFELGARHEWQSARPQDSTLSRYRGRATSVSAGSAWEFTPGYQTSLSLSRSQRMPGTQELYANGVHFATLSYELGDANLGKETAYTVDLGLHKTDGDLRFSVNVFFSRIQGYIYGKTLDQHHDFRLIQYTQDDASFAGLEAEVSYQFSPNVGVTVFGDAVRARLRHGGGNLPRIPPARIGVRTHLAWGPWDGFVEYTQALRQNRIAAYEEATAGYGLLDAGVTYRGQTAGTDYLLYLKGSNLLNKLAYRHSSFISRAAPVRGRNVMAGVRVEF